MKRALRGLALLLALTAGSCCEFGKFKGECPVPIPSVTECLSSPPGPSTACPSGDPEPNDTMPMARDMAAAGCDNATVAGSIGGANDTDYFRAHTTLCTQGRPAVETDTAGVEACLFVQCSTGSTSVTNCSDDSLVRHHPSGLLGCCVSGPGKVDFAVTCSGSNEDVDAFLVTTAAPGGSVSCAPYSIRYHL